MRRAINHLKKADPVIASIIEQVGPCKMVHSEPTFEALARSIVYQQLSGKAAGTIYGRLAAAASDPLTPEAVLQLTHEQLRAVGLSTQKARYVYDLAERTNRMEIDFPALQNLDDQQVIDLLTQVKGVGVWTVQMFLMFSLQRPNVLPTGDLGIRNAVKKAYRMRKMPTPADVEKRAKSWHPYCTIASWYLWRSLEAK
ncbi:MAG: DNA-3-methyladenine glycosylase [Bryobacteraceae bacterium]